MIYIKTSLPGISISNTGSVKNNITGKILKISKRGYFSYNEKPVNLAKLLLETFKGIKPKSGRINFIDGNIKNWDPNNLEYRSKLNKLPPPSEPAIIEIIKCYLGSKEEINFRNVFKYRFQLQMILDERKFFEMHKDIFNIEVFKYYVSIKMPGYRQLSQHFKITVNDARRTVYFFMHKLIEDCRTDKIIKQ